MIPGKKNEVILGKTPVSKAFYVFATIMLFHSANVNQYEKSDGTSEKSTEEWHSYLKVTASGRANTVIKHWRGI